MLRDGIRQRRRGETRLLLSEVLSHFNSEVISRVTDEPLFKAATQRGHDRKQPFLCEPAYFWIIGKGMRKRKKKLLRETKNAGYLESSERKVWTGFHLSLSSLAYRTNRFKPLSDQTFARMIPGGPGLSPPHSVATALKHKHPSTFSLLGQEI